MILNNVITKICEDSFRGILICGINWGGEESDLVSAEADPVTYFSNPNAYSWKFRNKLLAWFNNWGHQLEGVDTKIGEFERSISYTNWLTSKAPNIKAIYQKCIKDYSSIFQTFNELKPRLLFLLSTQLLYAINSEDCLKIAIQIFGKCEKPYFVQHDITNNGKKLRRFKIGFQKFDKCVVVSLPHPTGSRNLDEKYIYSFRKEIGAIISEWKSFKRIN